MIEMRGGVEALGVGGFLKEIIVKYAADCRPLGTYANTIGLVLLCTTCLRFHVWIDAY
jgi:hypothetical protein